MMFNAENLGEGSGPKRRPVKADMELRLIGTAVRIVA